MALTFVFFSLAAFVLGAIPTAFIFAKQFKGIDIRQHGSGNVGATNASRVLGRSYGIGVFIIDFLKGALPVLLARIFFDVSQTHALWIGFAAILGHVFTPFLGFKGGKGVATGMGVIFSGEPAMGLMTAIFWLAILKLFKMVSVSSMASFFLLALVSFLIGKPLPTSLFFLSIAVFSVWTHRDNINRMLSGAENRVSWP